MRLINRYFDATHLARRIYGLTLAQLRTKHNDECHCSSGSTNPPGNGGVGFDVLHCFYYFEKAERW